MGPYRVGRIFTFKEGKWEGGVVEEFILGSRDSMSKRQVGRKLIAGCKEPAVLFD